MWSFFVRIYIVLGQTAPLEPHSLAVKEDRYEYVGYRSRVSKTLYDMPKKDAQLEKPVTRSSTGCSKRGGEREFFPLISMVQDPHITFFDLFSNPHHQVRQR